jgi:hypothetical protein
MDFLLLAGILILGVRMAWFSFRPRLLANAVRLSQVIAAVYCLCLALAALYCIVQMFVPAS